ncbi:uncharacterized protein MELLADRAFT_116631 [Melampsora larici-populina 98AG31]|uniref:Uncharacterized protein n=1 Tax=Melampsora larici-populina (strain 98AG31 / pathotype 3-4-7) TaxID=747676 RepID=F4RNE0_MELLP|nr:uncharacterized protein MELLADRAFT_116631 [Melampsora larici-populina 98AG31]EGG05971.1 hypothetical protein MELLADRAFT_116631 [Melampsora larici-populina 98AG31]
MSLPSPLTNHSPHHFINSEKENREISSRKLLNHQINQTSIKSISPLTKARKTLPSPPTSIPSLTPPLVPSKRKSVVFNEERLGSAQSIPNHRSKSKPSTVSSQSINSSDQSNKAISSDYHKRARLALANPQCAPITPSTKQLSNGRDLPRSRPTSPLANRSSTKSLDRFYFHGRPSNEPIHRTQSPTLSASAPCKKTSNQADMLIDEDEDAVDSDGSDEAIVQELLPRNLNGHMRIRAYSLDAKRLNLGRDLTSFSVSDTSLAGPTTANEEDGSVPRPILKKTYTQIHIAESLEQATRSNGRPKLTFEAHMFPGRSHLASNNASRALLSITGAAQGRMMNISTRPLESTLPSASSSTQPVRGRSLAQRTSENVGDQTDDEASSVDGNDGQTVSELVPDAPTQEDCYIAAARTSLLTLQASLLPPPNQMRLDPVSPLAALTSPQKQQVGQLGNLLGSPREPKDILPRAPIHNPRLEPLEIKTKMKKRARCLGSSTSRRTGARISTVTSRASHAPPQTPDRQIIRPSDVQSLPRAVITLREVEEAYLSLHHNLSLLRQYWLKEGLLAEVDEEARLSKLFVDDLASSLMACLVREVENLCRLQSNLPELNPIGSSSGVASNPNTSIDAGSDLSRMTSISTSAAQPSTASKPTLQSSSPSEKVGISTNEIRRRVAEIETGQAGLRCIALFWSWPRCMVNFAEAHTQRLISLLVDIPGSLILRRKKNLPVIGTFNHIFKSQSLGLNLLAPHSQHIIDAVSHTLYLSAGKSGDKGKRVLLLGLGALEQLIKQIPEQILPRISRVVDPLLAALVSPEASSLRHQGLRGLGALINCTKSDWNQGLRQSAVSLGFSENSQSGKSLSDAQKSKKEDFREKISTYTFAHFTGQSSPRAWQVLNKQLSESFKVGDLGWVISSMATVIALLGKRIRRTDPPVTRCFKPHIQILLQKDGPVKQLAYQLWDYYILVMLIWSIENLQAKKSEEIWGLDKTQLSFFLQIFHNSSFWRTNSNLSSHTTSNSTMPVMSLNGQRLVEYDLLRLADHSRKPNLNCGLGTGKMNSGNGANIPPKIAPRPPTQIGKSVMIKRSTLHHSISAFLYGTIGCVQKYLLVPTLMLTTPVIRPEEWLESVAQSSRFRHLDIIWEEIIEPSLPNLLLSQIDDHRLYASEIIIALCGGIDEINENEKFEWNLERFLHPVYHDPPIKVDQPSKIDLEKFSELGFKSLIQPKEIPSLDLLWICCRSSNLISLVFKSLNSMNSISNSNEFQWIHDPSDPTFQIIPIPILNIWKAYLKSLKRVQASWKMIEPKFNLAFLEVLSVLKETLLNRQNDFVLSNRLRILRFRELYLVLKDEMGDELMKKEIIERDGQKISGLSDLMKFLIDGQSQNILKERTETKLENDLIEYSDLIEMILKDLILTRKSFGSPKLLNLLGREISSLGLDCQEEILKKSIGKISRKITSDLLKLIEAGVDWDEVPIETWMVKLIELNLLSFVNVTDHSSEVAVQIDLEISSSEVLIDLIKFLGRCSDESFGRMMIGCSDGLVKYLECHLENIGNGTDQLYQACLNRYSSYEGIIPEEMQENFIKLVLIPFESSSFDLDHQFGFVNQVLLPFSKTKNGIFLSEENQMIKSLFNTHVMVDIEKGGEDTDPLVLDPSRVEVEEPTDSSMFSPPRENLKECEEVVNKEGILIGSGSNVQDELEMERTDQFTSKKDTEAFKRSRSSSLSSIGSGSNVLDGPEMERTDQVTPKKDQEVFKRSRSSSLSSIGSEFSRSKDSKVMSDMEVDQVKNQRSNQKSETVVGKKKGKGKEREEIKNRRRSTRHSSRSTQSLIISSENDQFSQDELPKDDSRKPKKTLLKREKTLIKVNNNLNTRPSLSAVGGSGSSSSSRIPSENQKEGKSNTQSPKKVGKRSRTISVTSHEDSQERGLRKRRRSNRIKQNDTSYSGFSGMVVEDNEEQLTQNGSETTDTELTIEAPQAMVVEEVEPLIETPEVKTSEEVDANCEDTIEVASKSNAEPNRELDHNMTDADGFTKSSVDKDVEESPESFTELVDSGSGAEGDKSVGNEEEVQSLDKTVKDQSLKLPSGAGHEENTYDPVNISSTKRLVNFVIASKEKGKEVERLEGEKSGTSLRSPSFLSMSSSTMNHTKEVVVLSGTRMSLLLGRSSSTSLAIGGEVEEKRSDEIEKNVNEEQVTCQDPATEGGNIPEGSHDLLLESHSTTPIGDAEVEHSDKLSSREGHHSTVIANDEKSDTPNWTPVDESSLDIKPTAFSYTLSESLEANPWAELAPPNTTRTQVDSTDQCEKSIESVDIPTSANSRSIRKSRQMLSPVVVIPYNPLRYFDPKGRGTSQSSSKQSSSQIDHDSGSRPIARTRSQARLRMSLEHSSSSQLSSHSPQPSSNISQVDLHTTGESKSREEKSLEDEDQSDDDDEDQSDDDDEDQSDDELEEISNTRKLEDDRSNERVMSPATKRPRRSEIGLDSYQPDSILLERVTRSERPLTRSSSRSDQGLENVDGSQKGELSHSKIDPDLLRVQLDRSHSVSSRSSSGSRKSLRSRTLGQRKEPEVPKGPMVNQDDHSVVNETNELVESTQDIRAQAENFSTEKLLKLTRVTASLVEERLSKKKSK